MTWLIHMWNMAHSYLWHDSFICETWLIHMCDMTHPYDIGWSMVAENDMTHSYVWHDSFICEMWLIRICDMPHLYNMGWLRLVGSLKWQVSFAEYRLFYRALLQKRPIILRSLLIEATPYWVKHGLRQWHDSFICQIWLIHIRNMIHSYDIGWRMVGDCDMTHSYV